jgi:TP53 regulating kinase and related kinases
MSTDSEIVKSHEVSSIELIKGFKLLKQGAEARVYLSDFKNDNNNRLIGKERFTKTYRHPELDRSLTTKRIKTEVKLLNKASNLGINVPKVIKTDPLNGVILMEYIEESISSRDYIFDVVKQTNDLSKVKQSLAKLSQEIGRIIAILHRNEIIHGDLTTSNILVQNSDNQNFKVFLIDFGLSSVSGQLEEKAVDLYVLERALLSTHSQQAVEIFEDILISYSREYGRNIEKVIERFEQVRMRGRKRTMIG